MRTKNSLKNIMYGLMFQVITVIINFVTRTIFIKMLGVEYLGINGLFSNVISMFSFAELGIGGAIVFSLYKPLAEKDECKISALINLYYKSYNIIATFVLSLGIIFMPFLRFITKGYEGYDNLIIIYSLFLINSVLSYFMAYKKSLITADQKSYIINNVTGIFNIVLTVVQIIFLVITKNYIIYLINQIIFTILQNIYISRICDRMYPFIKENKNARLNKNEYKEIFKNVYSLFLYKISGIVINSTDNIIISIFLGINIVGLYSNYTLIIGTISILLNIIFNSITASVGNLNAEGDIEKKYFIFKTINFMNFWFFSFSTICLLVLTNNFITLWLNKDYVLSEMVIFIIMIDFYTKGMQNANTVFRDATGIFSKGKYKPLIAAIINILVSIILVQKIGLIGVFLGTIISRALTYFWHDPFILHKYIFRKSSKKYFFSYIYNFIILMIVFIITKKICNYFYKGTLSSLIVQSIICFILINGVYIIIFRNREEYN
ncbi:MAG: lipopolysaccharide biosynthesis protein, partial [Clostridium saudiense]